MTREERIRRRKELIETGSAFAADGECGEGDFPLPCGICDECVDQGCLDVP